MSVCVSVCLSVCVFVCVHVCLSVYTITKKNASIHLKLEHIVVYENSSDQRFFQVIVIVINWDKFDIGNCAIKVKVTASLQNFFSIYHNTNCQVLYLSFGT